MNQFKPLLTHVIDSYCCVVTYVDDPSIVELDGVIVRLYDALRFLIWYLKHDVAAYAAGIFTTMSAEGVRR